MKRLFLTCMLLASVFSVAYADENYLKKCLKNRDISIELCKKAFIEKNPHSVYEVSKKFSVSDPQTSAALLEEAADNMVKIAQHELITAYQKGIRGFPKSPEKAEQLSVKYGILKPDTSTTQSPPQTKPSASVTVTKQDPNVQTGFSFDSHNDYLERHHSSKKNGKDTVIIATGIALLWLIIYLLKKSTISGSSKHTESHSEEVNNNYRKQTTSNKGNKQGNPLFEELFALTGYVARAQGTISEAQIEQVKKAFDFLELNENERMIYQHKFNTGKSHDFSPEKSCKIITELLPLLSSEQKSSFISFCIELLFPIITSDGIISNEEQRRILIVSRALEIPDELILSYINEYNNRFSKSHRETKEEWAFRVLGLKPSATFEEIKVMYRRLIKKYHPDRVALLNLPEHLKEKTRREYENKSKEINEAYTVLKEKFRT
ncbi:DnaJ domain-containing protein [uncultured Ruminobacter sp.]|uniref:DnaJ domain-containing protein n=1 Tax=uncultured Ruminobacter sp. TaxID=538947 RepID=UPI0025F0184D|nr:DnaJ domain-containing protein [uncultured Ruminobacter sp.]